MKSKLVRLYKAELVKRSAELEKLAVNTKHRRLENALRLFAHLRGFSASAEWTATKRHPDVFQSTLKGEYHFVADAKVQKNQSSGEKTSRLQIKNYVGGFHKMLLNGSSRGGFIAMASDDYKAATQWAAYLHELTSKDYPIFDGSGNGPKFRVTTLGGWAWIVWW